MQDLQCNKKGKARENIRFCEVYILLKVKCKKKSSLGKVGLQFSDKTLSLSFLSTVVIATATVQCDSVRQGGVHALLVELSMRVRPTRMRGLSETRWLKHACTDVARLYSGWLDKVASLETGVILCTNLFSCLDEEMPMRL